MRKANVTILASILAITLTAMAVGAGTMAWFSDTETSTDNVIVAGTIDIELLSGSFSLTDVKPCEPIEPVIVEFRNIGQNPGYMYYRFTYEDFDKDYHLPEHFVDITDDEFAALIYLELMQYDHYGPNGYDGGLEPAEMSDLVDTYDTNGDGEVSLYELKNRWLPWSTTNPLAVDEGGMYEFTFHMADSLLSHTWGSGEPTEYLEFDVEDNAPQANGISITATFVLRQNPSSENSLPT